MPLTLVQANRIIDAALARRAELGCPPMAIVVLDDSGNLKSAQRDDGASMFRIEVATGKAWGAVAMGASSRALKKRAEDLPHFFAGLAATAQGRLLAQTGAVLIVDRDLVLGAVGASGGTGDEDEAVCIHGVAAAGLSHR